jgi:hypothetical protein
MTYRGHIQGGAVVLEKNADLPDGTPVTVCLFDFLEENIPSDETGPSLYERMKPVIGIANGLPPDASENKNHYLYGASKTR